MFLFVQAKTNYVYLSIRSAKVKHTQHLQTQAVLDCLSGLVLRQEMVLGFVQNHSFQQQQQKKHVRKKNINQFVCTASVQFVCTASVICP